MHTHIIINPVSAGGKTRGRIPRILADIKNRLGDSPTYCITEKPLDALRAAQRAIQQGCELLIVTGGDGTLHEAVNGIFLNGIRPSPSFTLGIIASGTGNGLALSLGLPTSLEEQVELIARGSSKEIDLGKLEVRSPRGTPVLHYFVNECQIGIGAAVVRRVEAHQKNIGGLLAYGLGTLGTIIGHPNQEIQVRFAGGRTFDEPLLGLAIGNGSRTAAGMQLTPGAALDDGLLDTLVIHGQSVFRRFRSFPKIYAGTQRDDPGFSYVRSTKLEIASSEPVLVAADGELLGTLPCSIGLIAGALRVYAPIQPMEVTHATGTHQLAESRI